MSTIYTNAQTACLQAVASTLTRVEHENRIINQYTARDFTPFQFMTWGEVPSTHLLAFFLNPAERHGQGELFQQLFLAKLRQALPNEGRGLPAGQWRVEAERRHVEYGQLDLLLTASGNRFGICLENKPRTDTADQPNQLASYRALLQRRHQERYLLIYLSSGPRTPDPSSLDPLVREELTRAGQYINLTYQDFILPLLDEWQHAAPPETLRTFLRQFRYHIEQWLQLQSTKPAQFTLHQHVVSTLLSNPEHVRASFAIAQALPEVKRQLLADLVEKLQQHFPALDVRMHWKHTGFLQGVTRTPLLLRRPAAAPTPAAFPWGRSALALELYKNRLFYGIRFDKIDLLEGDQQGHPWPEEAPLALANLLEQEPRLWESWLWWDWVGPENDVELFTQLADGTLLAGLLPKLETLQNALDQYYNVLTLPLEA